MKFGPLSVADARGAISAHAVRAGDARLKKGQRVGAAEQAALRAAGVETVIAAMLEADDVPEDEAAERLALVLGGAGLRREPPFTGRVNLYAEQAGLLIVDKARIDAVNRVHDAITVATLPAFRAVATGDMAATVKIIPFAAPSSSLDRACSAAGEHAVRVAPFRPLRVGVVSTLLPGLKPSVILKTLGVLEARLAPARATIEEERRTPHAPRPLAEALAELRSRCDLLIVFGASAITDRRDVIPSAIEAAGGRVEHFGMPVDPGNLLLVGDIGGTPVIGAPGCARSPKENGFDWVLGRLLADVPITRADIQGMGVGGLLMEIETRPQPREGDA